MTGALIIDVDIFETEAARLYPFLSALLLVHSLLCREQNETEVEECQADDMEDVQWE